MFNLSLKFLVQSLTNFEAEGGGRDGEREGEINNTSITRVENYKYLGIIFYYNMKWDRHIESKIKVVLWVT